MCYVLTEPHGLRICKCLLHNTMVSLQKYHCDFECMRMPPLRQWAKLSCGQQQSSKSNMCSAHSYAVTSN